MKNFKLDDHVEFHSTSSIDLDGKQGTIIGVYSDHQTNKFWIVLLDNPLPDRKAVVMTDSCLKKVDLTEDHYQYNKLLEQIENSKINNKNEIIYDGIITDLNKRWFEYMGYKIKVLKHISDGDYSMTFSTIISNILETK